MNTKAEHTYNVSKRDPRTGVAFGTCIRKGESKEAVAVSIFGQGVTLGGQWGGHIYFGKECVGWISQYAD